MKLPKIDIIAKVIVDFCCMFCLYELIYQNKLLKQSFPDNVLLCIHKYILCPFYVYLNKKFLTYLEYCTRDPHMSNNV